MPPLKQSSLLVYLIMLTGFVVGFLYISQLDATAAVPPVPEKLQLTSLKNLEHISIDYSLLASDQFKQLRIFGELPVKAQGSGKNNPFQ